MIKSLVSGNAIVICCGGGGIPVIEKDNHYVGVPAVIDKDRLSALLAKEIQADALIISTAIDSVRTGFGTEKEVSHSILTISEARGYLESGEFPAGSMGPKISSLIDAVENVDGLKSVLCQPGDAIKALRGDGGTIITP